MNDIQKIIQVVTSQVRKLSIDKQKYILNLFREIQKIQKSELTKEVKLMAIKKILWTNQSIKNRFILAVFWGVLSELSP